MKNFILGIVATVLGGFALFILTDVYSDWSANKRYEIKYSIKADAAFVGADELQAVVQSFDKLEDESGKIAVVQILNKTEEDIRNAKFTIIPTEQDFDDTNLFGFGYASSTNGQSPEAQMRRSDVGIEVSFPVLEGDNGANIWILHKPPQGFRVFADKDELNLDEDRPWEKETNLDFVFVLIVGLAALIFGAWGGSVISDHMLKKAGYNPKQIAAEYQQAVANEQAAKVNADSEKGRNEIT